MTEYASDTTKPHSVDSQASLHVSPFEMPFSSLASSAAREAAVRQYRAEQRWRENGLAPGKTDIGTLRAQVNHNFFIPLLDKQRARWGDRVDKSEAELGGVRTDVFTPAGGMTAGKTGRVLINVHGGGFMVGARTLSEVESLPIAALCGIKVVSVDYRMAPEHRFPAASDDLIAVYGALLEDHAPGAIGIYGGSAGGILTAQSIPALLARNLPLPGALGMFGATGQPGFLGDSVALANYVYGPQASLTDEADGEAMSYFAGVDFQDAFVSPILWSDLLRQFPPSLLITATRAPEMSGMIDAHNRLALADARSRLHVWDGLWHCFYVDADLPESREAERIIVDFFDQNLQTFAETPRANSSNRGS